MKIDVLQKGLYAWVGFPGSRLEFVFIWLGIQSLGFGSG